MRFALLTIFAAVCAALSDEAWEDSGNAAQSEHAVHEDTHAVHEDTHEEEHHPTPAVHVEAPRAAPELTRKLEAIELTGPNQVIEVTDDSFHTEVSALKRAVIVLFYNPETTEYFERQYEYAARVLHDEVRLVRIEGEPNFQTRVNHQIQSYPQIRMFARHKNHGAHPYYGQWDNSSMVTAFRAFAEEVDRDIAEHERLLSQSEL